MVEKNKYLIKTENPPIQKVITLKLEITSGSISKTILKKFKLKVHMPLPRYIAKRKINY